MNKEIEVNSIFHQESQPECGIPAHWCVQYFTKDNGWPQYEYTDTYEEAKAWAIKHGYGG